MGSFVEVSITQRLRVMGDDVRLHKAYPGNWQARPLPHHCLLSCTLLHTGKLPFT